MPIYKQPGSRLPQIFITVLLIFLAFSFFPYGLLVSSGVFSLRNRRNFSNLWFMLFYFICLSGFWMGFPYGFLIGLGAFLIREYLKQEDEKELKRKRKEFQQGLMLTKKKEKELEKRFKERDKTINMMIKRGKIDKHQIKTQFADLIPTEIYSTEEGRDKFIEEHINNCLKKFAEKEKGVRKQEDNLFLAKSYLQRGKTKTYKNNLKQIGDLLKVTPIEFEKWVKEHIFEKEGWQVSETKKTGDGGIDLILWKNDEKLIAQCKRFRKTVGEPLVRDFYGTMVSEGVSKGYFVTTGLFSLSALKFAGDKPIEMIDRRVLAQGYTIAST